MSEDIMDRDVQPHPWRIYGEEFQVPDSKMGKASVEEDMEKERMAAEGKSIEKSLALLDAMAYSVAPTPGDEAIILLKACKACMGKGAEGEKKAYLGELAIPEKEGEKPKFTGEGAMRAGSPAGGGGCPPPSPA